MSEPQVLIPIADGSEELEAVTLIDLLRRARINVTVAGLSAEPVTCARGTVIIPDQSIDDVLSEQFDLMVLPGGLPGADNLNADPRIHQLIKRLNNDGKYVAAICAAPKVLVASGVANGKTITAYPGALSEVDTANINLIDEPVHIDGKVITSRGPGTAMDFALTLIEILKDKATRDQVEAGLVRNTG